MYKSGKADKMKKPMKKGAPKPQKMVKPMKKTSGMKMKRGM